MRVAHGQDETNTGRQAFMALLARADRAALEGLVTAYGDLPQAEPVRGPETGLVTIRGRMGGGGAPFNLGEATVTRATVRVGSRVGHAYALGRDAGKATMAATLDALWQDETRRDAIEGAIAAPLRIAEAEADQRRREEAAATRVDFFTMVRGED